MHQSFATELESRAQKALTRSPADDDTNVQNLLKSDICRKYPNPIKKLFLPALFALCTLLCSALPLAAQFTNFQAATNVLGQPNFTTGTSGTALNKMNQPRGVAVDPTTGKIFVSEQAGNRILRFASAAALMNGATAEAVFAGAGVTATSLNTPLGMDVDAGGGLWVADFANNRVLRFDNAATLANGANADAVLGQPNFTSNTFATTAAAMWSVNGVHLDAGGRLWVSDGNNCRVLRFDNAAVKANGANADGVLGQANFTTRACSTSQTTVRTTVGVHADASGRLYVGDFNANRVLIFLNAGGLPNGAPASYVFGQPSFTSSTSNTGGLTASALSEPNFPFFDEATSSLYVSDRGNHRVLRYGIPPVTASGVTVSGRVLTSGGSGISGATVKATDGAGVSRTTRANSFGYYYFEGLPSGEVYVFSVTAKGYTFASQVINVNDTVENLDFTAIE